MLDSRCVEYSMTVEIFGSLPECYRLLDVGIQIRKSKEAGWEYNEEEREEECG